ncbi:MAG: 3-isopropylmalate dehydratase large subunit [Chloroflexi bacterium]|nr:3-isopropylmalate dehydratase large subunit [Chloroflexota bacterium]
MAGMTMAEKVLARASGRERVAAGEFVEAKIDLAMIHEITGAPSCLTLRELGIEKVWDPARIVVFNDHAVPADSEATATLQKHLREFVGDYGILNFYDLRDGICHQVLAEKGHVLPGSLIVGTDSHSCTYGALGAFSTGIGATEMVQVFATGRLWFKVPPTIKLVYIGQLPPGVTAKDMALMTVGRLGADGANYRGIEFAGPAVAGMGMSDRLTLCNMANETGAKVGMVAADGVTLDYLRDRARGQGEPVLPDADATYETTVEMDVSHLEPQVACHPAVENVKPISEVAGKEIHQAFLGSCTNGRLEDLRQAATVLKGRRIPRGVRMLVVPASQEVYLAAIREGLIETFLEAGAVVTNPNCAACGGIHGGIMAQGEVCIATTNRNFPGRMGRGTETYLASPSVVAASALAGKIADPRRL